MSMIRQTNNTSCPTNGVPTPLPGVPNNISYIAVPGQNPSAPWMVSCCDPYPVHLSDKCWLWCEVDPELESASDAVVAEGFSACMSTNGRDRNESIGLLYHDKKNSAATRRVSLLHSVVVALATSMVVAMTSVV
ncbi:uncharacterized protein B0H64DRAFT_26637 [Chaetomium fimeti]|uniref:Uncharacterized protein n=1 Tax=Chaetomium fimeti TaxID=1854472 RepID=A0AAE0HSC2_9PEZI|nr:hypothetical protein B0H64DRAFT_26637 [Chaetomium fimeti]